ncbi:MAG: VanZ family protein [Nanoarchaeota archaeon]
MILWFEKHNKISWMITIIIGIIIFYVSSLSFAPGIPGGFPWKSMVYHFYAFFFLSAFLLISLIQGKKKNKNLIYFGIIIAVIYGISDEIHQLFVPNRGCTISDMLIDSAGILFAGLIYSLMNLLRFKDKNEERDSQVEEIKRAISK